MLMIKARDISLLVELVVSMHGRTESKPGLSLQWMPFYSCQQWYGHSDQTFACWHINQGHVPVCPPHLKDFLMSLTDKEHAGSHTRLHWIKSQKLFLTTTVALIIWNRLCKQCLFTCIFITFLLHCPSLVCAHSLTQSNKNWGHFARCVMESTGGYFPSSVYNAACAHP